MHVHPCASLAFVPIYCRPTPRRQFFPFFRHCSAAVLAHPATGDSFVSVTVRVHMRGASWTGKCGHEKRVAKGGGGRQWDHWDHDPKACQPALRRCSPCLRACSYSCMLHALCCGAGSAMLCTGRAWRCSPHAFACCFCICCFRVCLDAWPPPWRAPGMRSMLATLHSKHRQLLHCCTRKHSRCSELADGNQTNASKMCILQNEKFCPATWMPMHDVHACTLR